MSATTLTAEQATEQLLRAADELFYPRGVAAVTMADIRDQAGVSLRRLYSLYPTKADLIGGWLDHRHEVWTAWLQDSVSAAVEQGSTHPDAVFDVLGVWLSDTDYRGCGFINTLLEQHELTSDHRRIIQEHKAHLVDLLSASFTDPEAAAVLIDGAIVQTVIFQSLAPLDAARRTAHLIERASHPS